MKEDSRVSLYGGLPLAYGSMSEDGRVSEKEESDAVAPSRTIVPRMIERRGIYL